MEKKKKKKGCSHVKEKKKTIKLQRRKLKCFYFSFLFWSTEVLLLESGENGKFYTVRIKTKGGECIFGFHQKKKECIFGEFWFFDFLFFVETKGGESS